MCNESCYAASRSCSDDVVQAHVLCGKGLSQNQHETIASTNHPKILLNVTNDNNGQKMLKYITRILYVTHSQSVDGRAEPAICAAFGLRFGWPSDGLAFHVLKALGLWQWNAGTNNNNYLVAEACHPQ